MLKVFILSLVLIIAPFTHAETKPETANLPELPKQSIKVVSDLKGTLYLEGRRMAKVGKKSVNPLEIIRLPPATYHLSLKISRHAEIQCDVPLSSGQDAYVYFKLGQPEIGTSLQQLNYHPNRHIWVTVLISVGAVAVTVLVVSLATALSHSNGHLLY